MCNSGLKLVAWIIFASLLVLTCRQQPHAQSQNGFEMELGLVADYDAMIAADPYLRYDSLAPNFRTAIIKVLAKKDLFEYPFDSLATRLKIIRSSDKKLRVFSWDEKTGGSRHDFSAVVQYMGSNGKLTAHSINNFRITGEKEYTEAGYYEVHTLAKGSDPRYLLLGWGTFGAGHQHYVARVLQYKEDRLVDCNQCFDGKDFWPIVLSRSDKAELAFDTETNSIFHKQFRENEEAGYYAATGKMVVLKWDGTTFIKSVK